MQVVWFKRDLRVHDHRPLYKATQLGKCLCLYVYEPELLGSAEFDTSHLEFINQSLQELDERLQAFGGGLTFRVGEVTEVLDRLHQECPIEGLWSHEETGNKLTYDRDLRVAAWANRKGIRWEEAAQNGVVRRLKSRDGWSKQRNQFMKDGQAPAISSIVAPAGVEAGSVLSAEQLGMPPTNKVNLQVGGESEGLATLDAFLNQRGENYSREMSSPVTAVTSCSRLSAYLAWGCLSIRRVVQELDTRKAELRDLRAGIQGAGGWLKSMRSFESRLSWHCHFMQKLEDEPSLEFENMSRAYDGLREGEFQQSRFDAWCAGQTGYPLVDACMRALAQQSWINFRMRAMLVSFASYHLWLHWRPTAVHLAAHFLDFEPGIHFSQFQMQSGTTGINTVRIYSPIKQVADQDPEGLFIRQYVPELKGVPKQFLAEPHKMTLQEQSKAGCRIDKDYPRPIVEHAVAYRAARDRLFEVRKQDRARAEALAVVKKHGSRKRSGGTKKRAKTSAKAAKKSTQTEFDF